MIYRVRRQSIEPEGAKRRLLLEAVQIEEKPDGAVLTVGGEALLVMPTLEGLLTAMDLQRDDLEAVTPAGAGEGSD